MLWPVSASDPRPAKDVVREKLGQSLRKVGRLADSLDRAERGPRGTERPDTPGVAATAWAVAKAAGVVASSPVGVPTLAVAARRTAQDCALRVDMMGEHFMAVIEDRPTPLPARVTRRLDAGQKWLITSDLHRCNPGRLDWPRRQGTKDLYVQMLEHYAERGWGLIENGDVEDFWMPGGSAWGAVYDIARVAGGVVAAVDDSMRLDVLKDQLDRTVDNNALIYRTITEGFLRPGRYHRTIGNHDEAFVEPELAARLEGHLPGARPVDNLLLVHAGDGREPADVRSVDEVAALVTHGHLTDSWNGPGYSALGRAITWLALGLDDLPTPSGTEGLPDEEAVDRLLAGRGRNRLVSLDPRFGGNRRFDSLDEERLFAALAAAAPAPEAPHGGWPWMLFGHTHYPMMKPRDAAGESVHYANSGCAVLDHAVSALEWDPSAGDEPVRLVLWRDVDGEAQRKELTADGPRLRVA